MSQSAISWQIHWLIENYSLRSRKFSKHEANSIYKAFSNDAPPVFYLGCVVCHDGHLYVCIFAVERGSNWSRLQRSRDSDDDLAFFHWNGGRPLFCCPTHHGCASRFGRRVAFSRNTDF